MRTHGCQFLFSDSMTAMYTAGKKKIKHVKPLKIRWAKSRQSSSKIRVGRLQLFTFPGSTQKTYALLLDGDSHSRKTK